MLKNFVMIRKDFEISDLDFAKNPDGLVPAVVQDYATLKVLMLGYVNREALEKTLDTGKMTFYSRSRQCLWTKGETSGNFLSVREMYADCDNDTLLVMAEPAGPACHRGTKSCFNTDDDQGFIRELQEVILRRKAERPDGSYTVKLFDKGTNKIAQKVGEEAVETVIEAVDNNDDAMIYEASDLIYHLLVLLVHKGLSISDLEKELARRHR